jgi:hypothetical protein
VPRLAITGPMLVPIPIPSTKVAAAGNRPAPPGDRDKSLNLRNIVLEIVESDRKINLQGQ